MDIKEAEQILEEINNIRKRAGLPQLDEISRRGFLKGLGAGAAAMALPGAAAAQVFKKAEPAQSADWWEADRRMSDDTKQMMRNFKSLLKSVNQCTDAAVEQLMRKLSLKLAVFKYFGSAIPGSDAPGHVSMLFMIKYLDKDPEYIKGEEKFKWIANYQITKILKGELSPVGGGMFTAGERPILKASEVPSSVPNCNLQAKPKKQNKPSYNDNFGGMDLD